MSGFKETEIGFVPKNWQVVELGAVCTQRKEIITPNSNGKGKYVGLEHIQTGVFRLKNYGNESEVKSAKYKFHDGDILYGKLRPYLDKAVLVDLSGICSTDIIVLKGTEQLLQNYLIGLVHTNYFIEYSKRTTSGVNHPRTSWNLLKKFKFGLPTLEEQRNIAHILSKIQSAIETQEKIIQTTTELKKALMQKLFTEGLKGEPQKETEIGLVPKSWEVKSLAEIGDDFMGGGTPSTKISDYWGGDIHWTTSKKLSDSIYLNEGEKKITKLGLENSSTSLVPHNNLIISTRVSVGKVAINSIDIAISQDLTGVIIDHSKYDIEFLAYQIKTNRIQIIFESHKRGATIKGITREDLKRIKLLIPKLDEQREIGSILKRLDSKKAVAVRKSASLQSLFKSMLHHLMTGQIRVKDLRF